MPWKTQQNHLILQSIKEIHSRGHCTWSELLRLAQSLLIKITEYKNQSLLLQLFGIARVLLSSIAGGRGPVFGISIWSRAAVGTVSPGAFTRVVIVFIRDLVLVVFLCYDVCLRYERSRSAVAWARARHTMCERAGVPRATECPSQAVCERCRRRPAAS